MLTISKPLSTGRRSQRVISVADRYDLGEGCIFHPFMFSPPAAFDGIGDRELQNRPSYTDQGKG